MKDDHCNKRIESLNQTVKKFSDQHFGKKRCREKSFINWHKLMKVDVWFPIVKSVRKC